MTTAKAKELIKQYQSLKSCRQPYETTWDEITDLVVPMRSKFTETGIDYEPDLEQYDPTATQSAEYLAATLLNGLVNQETKWFELQFKDRLLNENIDANLVLEERVGLIYELFNTSATGFYTSVAEMFLDLVAYGTSAMEVFYEPGKGIKYRAIHLSQLYIATDKSGFVDTVYRKFKFTARQAAQMWGMENLPKDMQKAVENEPHKKFEFVRCVKPQESFEKKMRSKQHYYSAYIAVDACKIVSEGGLKNFPYVVPRWLKVPDQDYGRSPSWTALPSVRVLQDITMSGIIIGQKMAEPQLLAADDGVMFPINPDPGGVIYGGINPVDGRDRIKPLNTGSDLGPLQFIAEDAKENIRRAFYNNALNLQNLPQMTAEEVNARRDEDFRTLAPNANRVIQEALNPLILATYNLMKEHKMFPEVDIPELQGQALEIKMMSPLSRTAKLQEVNSFSRMVNTVIVPLANIDPTVFDTINVGRTVERLGDDLGIPLSILNTPAERAQIEEERRQQQEMQMQMALAAQADQAEAQLANNNQGPEDDGEI